MRDPDERVRRATGIALEHIETEQKPPAWLF
jgi:hypothetical protein